MTAYINGVADSFNDIISTSYTPFTKESALYDSASHSHWTENHIHSLERWFGKSADQSGNNWGAVEGLTLFRAISGDGAFGTDANDEAKVLGSTDTPVIVGKTRYDPHRMLVYDSSVTTPWVLRIIYGTGTMADAETALQYTDIMVVVSAAPGAGGDSSVFEIRMPKLAVGTQLWAKAKNATNNATIDFYIGIHEYADYHI